MKMRVRGSFFLAYCMVVDFTLLFNHETSLVHLSITTCRFPWNPWLKFFKLKTYILNITRQCCRIESFLARPLLTVSANPEKMWQDKLRADDVDQTETSGSSLRVRVWLMTPRERRPSYRGRLGPCWRELGVRHWPSATRERPRSRCRLLKDRRFYNTDGESPLGPLRPRPNRRRKS